MARNTGRARAARITAAVATVILLATPGTLGWRAWQAAQMRSALRTSGPEQTLRIYLRARAGGYYGVAREALLPATRREMDAPNMVPDYSDLFMRGLRLDGPNYSMRAEQPDDVQFVVHYSSVWRSSIGEPPGARAYFAYVTPGPGDGRWYVRGLGTGP